MHYDAKLADRIRKIFSDMREVEEKYMFGGIVFMVKGHMCVGVCEDMLMARVGPDQYESALKLKGAKPMDFTGKPLRGFIFVEPDALKTSANLKRWIERSRDFVNSLAPKKKKDSTRKKKVRTR